MKMKTYRFLALAAASGVAFQLLGGCSDFLTRFAGAGAIVAGLVTLFTGAGN